MAKFLDIPINKIAACPDNRDVDPSTASYASLVASMREHGFVGNIIVRLKNGKYEIVDGHHRYEAAVEAKLKSLPCIVAEIDDTKAALMRFLCNENRRNLTGYDHYVMVTKMRDHGMKRKEIADAVGKSIEWVKKVLYLDSAPDHTKEMARSEGWSFSKFISETSKSKTTNAESGEKVPKAQKARSFWLSKSLKWTKEMAANPALKCVVEVAERTGVEMVEGQYYDVQVSNLRVHQEAPEDPNCYLR